MLWWWQAAGRQEKDYDYDARSGERFETFRGFFFLTFSFADLTLTVRRLRAGVSVRAFWVWTLGHALPTVP